MSGSLLPPEVVATLPKWLSNADEADPIASVKWFLFGATWAWYVVEFDGTDTCFGLIITPVEPITGYFSVSGVSKASGFAVERDADFVPTRLSELRRLHETPTAVAAPKPLLPPEVLAKLPAWGSTAEEADPVASVRLFFPGGWTWYVVEYDGEDTCFGLVAGFEVESGYFSLSELQEIGSTPDDLFVQRDERFTPARLSALRRLHRAELRSDGGGGRDYVPEP